MACFDKSSPALKEMLFKIYRARKPMELDERIFEFGAVEYHIKSSVSDPFITYLSVATPVVYNQQLPDSPQIFEDKFKMIRRLHKDAVEINQPAKQGYQITLKLDFSKIQNLKDPTKIISEISTLQAIILSYQLREMLQKLAVSDDDDAAQAMCKPVKFAYHPRETFFVVRQPAKITVVFPMSFKDDSEVIIANAFLQEFIDVSNSKAWEKAPQCSWSPIPPPELTGETFEDLNTNCGFISIDITSNHVKVKKLDKVVWSLLNFYAFVKYHLKCTQGFIHRRMRKRFKDLVEAFYKGSPEEDEEDNEAQGCRCINRLVRTTKTRTFTGKCQNITKKLKRIRYSIHIRGCGHLRRKCQNITKKLKRIRYSIHIQSYLLHQSIPNWSDKYVCSLFYRT